MTIYEEIIKIIVQKLGVPESEVKGESNLRIDLGADDLDMKEIVLALNITFSLLIPPSESEKFATVSNIFEYILYIKFKVIDLEEVVIHPSPKLPNIYREPKQLEDPFPWIWPNVNIYGDPNKQTIILYTPPKNSVNDCDKKIAKGIAWGLDKVERQVPYDQQTVAELRTGNTPEALAYMDCSEYVCRYLNQIGLTSTVQYHTSSGLRDLGKAGVLFDEVSTPRAGDIYTWVKPNGKGHTGVVRSYDPATGMVTYIHETSYDLINFAVQGSAHIDSKTMKNHPGWNGFFRPKLNCPN